MKFDGVKIIPIRYLYYISIKINSKFIKSNLFKIRESLLVSNFFSHKFSCQSTTLHDPFFYDFTFVKDHGSNY